MTSIHFSQFDESINVIKGVPTVLGLKNKQVFADFCFNLFSGDEKVKVFDENDFKDSSDYVLIPDLLNFDLNSLKNIKIIYDSITKNFALYEERDDLAKKFYELQSLIEAVVFDGSDLDLTSGTEFDLKPLLKLFNIRFNMSEIASIYEKILKVVELFTKIAQNKTIIFINQLSFFGNSELESLYHEIALKQASVLFVEQGSANFNGASVYAYDEDMFLTKKLYN